MTFNFGIFIALCIFVIFILMKESSQPDLYAPNLKWGNVMNQVINQNELTYRDCVNNLSKNSKIKMDNQDKYKICAPIYNNKYYDYISSEDDRNVKTVNGGSDYNISWEEVILNMSNLVKNKSLNNYT